VATAIVVLVAPWAWAAAVGSRAHVTVSPCRAPAGSPWRRAPAAVRGGAPGPALGGRRAAALHRAAAVTTGALHRAAAVTGAPPRAWAAAVTGAP
jgi:hypothetical protein